MARNVKVPNQIFHLMIELPALLDSQKCQKLVSFLSAQFTSNAHCCNFLNSLCSAEVATQFRKEMNSRFAALTKKCVCKLT